jgi:hypothetical protein
MLIHRKFTLTGQDRRGDKAIVVTDSRDTADHLVVFWKESGFSGVKMTEADPEITPPAPNYVTR